MKRIILAAVLAMGLGGCTTLDQIGTAVSAVTRSVTNPVTKNDLYQIESGVQIVFTGLNAYKRSCIAGVVDTNCRANIVAIQVYTRQLPPLLAQLRGFVKQNDQVNAAVIYNQLTTLIANAKTAATNVGIKIGE